MPIATQSVVEQLAVDGKTKEDPPRAVRRTSVGLEASPRVPSAARCADSVTGWTGAATGSIWTEVCRGRCARLLLYDATHRAERVGQRSPVSRSLTFEVNYRDVEGELVSFRYGSLDDSQPSHRGRHHLAETVLGDTATRPSR